MAFPGKILNPLRLSLSAMNASCKSVSNSKQLCTVYAKYEPLRIWRARVEPLLLSDSFGYRYLLCVQRKFMQGFSLLGKRTFRSILGVPVIFGSIYFRPQLSHAMDGDEFLLDDYRGSFSDATNGEKDPLASVTHFRKVWMPVVLLLTVLINWDHPIALAMKFVFILLSTKPSHSSVYLHVEQMCRETMYQRPHVYIFKTLYANKVEVEDFKLFCLARIELGGQKFRLLGIFGTWWSLPSSEDVFSVLRRPFTRDKVNNLDRSKGSKTCHPIEESR